MLVLEDCWKLGFWRVHYSSFPINDIWWIMCTNSRILQLFLKFKSRPPSFLLLVLLLWLPELRFRLLGLERFVEDRVNLFGISCLSFTNFITNLSIIIIIICFHAILYRLQGGKIILLHPLDRLIFLTTTIFINSIFGYRHLNNAVSNDLIKFFESLRNLPHYHVLVLTFGRRWLTRLNHKIWIIFLTTHAKYSSHVN